MRCALQHPGISGHLAAAALLSAAPKKTRMFARSDVGGPYLLQHQSRRRSFCGHPPDSMHRGSSRDGDGARDGGAGEGGPFSPRPPLRFFSSSSPLRD